MYTPQLKSLTDTRDAIVAYLTRCQDFTPGRYYGSFWSEKAYHGPLLNWHGGGSHHPRGAGSGGLGLWLAGQASDNADLLRRAEAAFDWVVTRQYESGGYYEIQNNEKPSDWELTGLSECSTIETAFVVHGLANALLAGLAPKASYMDCLQQAGHWFLSIERPEGSGIFPHHDRSPYDCLNANLHAGESLAAVFTVLRDVYDRPVNIFYHGARRTIRHTLTLQWPNGCFPYRADDGITINYTSLVVWCLLNTLDTLPEYYQADVAPADEVRAALESAAAFLRRCVADDGTLLWEGNETSTARHNIWSYVLTANVLKRIGGNDDNAAAAERLLGYVLSQRAGNGLLPMRDEGEEITECAYMQADILLFLLGM
ncbi:MAG: hypothetical protein ACYC63_06015 [Armatimonadota bacterium]